MRKINYIFIESDRPSDDYQSGYNDLSDFRHHFIVNSKGLVINNTDIQYPVSLIQGPIYDRDKYNKCSIYIRYCGSLKHEDFEERAQNQKQSKNGTQENQADITPAQRQLEALLKHLVQLRKHFSDAKILGLSELNGRELYNKNIIVNDVMNVLRKELSDLP